MRVQAVISCFLAIVIPVAWVSLLACATVDSEGIEERLETARTFWAGWTGQSLVFAWPPDGKASFDPNDHQKRCRNWRPIPTSGENRKSQCCYCDIAILIGRLSYKVLIIAGPGLKGVSLAAGPSGQFLMIGMWPLCLGSVLFAMPLFLMCCGTVRLRFRIRNCLCATCGYCLFGNDSGICPECGSRIITNTVIHQVKPT